MRGVIDDGTLVKRQDWMDDKVFEWACKEKQARLNSLERRQFGGKKALITIKAQHPLRSDGTPGPEYAQRLEKALEVKANLEAKGLAVDFITVGGVHGGHRTVSLAEAGKKWLIAHGVGEASIKEYPMILSGNDEDLVSARQFASDTDYAELHCVLSAGQWERARLFYISCGWQPTMHPITFLEADPNHSTVCELWGWFGVPAFAEGPDVVLEVTMKTRQKHLNESMEQ